MLRRRAFAVHDVAPDHGGTVEFVFAARGPGTRWLAERRAPATCWTSVGPLGRPFPLPRDPVELPAGRRRVRHARRCSPWPTRCRHAAAASTSCSARPARTGCSAR